MAQISNLDKKYDPAIEPTRELYNEYFGGGMNSIVFQEMRETRLFRMGGYNAAKLSEVSIYDTYPDCNSK